MKSKSSGTSRKEKTSSTATVVTEPTKGTREKPRPEPRVLHGHTLTKDTTFRDVCYAIRDGAFVTNDLPIIVSLEVHASFEQQETMIEIIQEAWKGLLVEPTPEMLADLEKGNIKQLPSPGELRNKILIKVKWAPPQQVGAQEATATEGDASVEDVWPDEGEDAGDSTKPKKPSKILHSLSLLGIYTNGHSFRSFSQPGKLW